MKTTRYCCRCCCTTPQTEAHGERVCQRCGAVTILRPVESFTRPAPRLYVAGN